MAPTKTLMKGKGRRQDEYDVIETGDDDLMADTSSNEEAQSELDCVIPDEQSDLETSVINSKLTLLCTSDEEGVSLYQHLAEMLSHVLARWDAGNSVDKVEEISYHLKRERMKSSLTVLTDRPATDDIVMRQWQLFKKIGREIPDINPVFGIKKMMRPKRRKDGDGSESGDKNATPTVKTMEKKPADDSEESRLAVLPDLMKQCQMFNMSGMGLPPTEYTRIALAMRELASSMTFKSMRFWGKILGTEKNYYIVETRLFEDDYDNLKNDDDDDVDERDDDDDNASQIPNLKSTVKDTPKVFISGDPKKPSNKRSQFCSSNSEKPRGASDDEIPMAYKAPAQIPKEETGHGVNTSVYYVCNEPGLPWIRLPDVKPQQITIARQITSLFTGKLDHVHATYPPFPGNEANYLRAQVARITSGTCISPIGYFSFDEDEEEEEHAESRDTCVRNEDFEGVAMRDLGDSSLQFWVHHVNYILPQGRTSWYNPLDVPTEEGEDEEELEEERKEPDEPEPEIPQPLLIPVSEDVDVGQSPPWITRLSSQFIPEHALVSVESVRWPGAVVAATDKGVFYENLYIGWGLKALESGFDPALPPEAVWEFPTGPEVIEQEDPTPEEEAAIRAALKEHEELLGGREEEEEEEELDAEDEELDED